MLPIPFHDIDPELRPYYDLFLSEGGQRGLQYAHKNVYLHFDDLAWTETDWNPAAVGLCSDLGGDSAFIDRDYWDTIPEWRREFLVFHELGHCLLSREHDNSKILDRSLLASLMRGGSSFGFGGFMDYCSPYWRDHYVDELFGVEELSVNGAAVPTYENYQSSTPFYFRENSGSENRLTFSRSFNPNGNPYEVAFNFRVDPWLADRVEITINEFSFRLFYSGSPTLFDLKLTRGEKTIGHIGYSYGPNILEDDRIRMSFRVIDGFTYFYADEYLLYFVEGEFHPRVDIDVYSNRRFNDVRVEGRALE